MLKRKEFTQLRLFKISLNDYHNYLRIREKTFKLLVSMAAPYLVKRNSVIKYVCSSISVEERLAFFVPSYLGTGTSLVEDLKLFAIMSPRTTR